MSDQQQATANGGGELTPQARNEIAQYRMQHLDAALSGAPMAVRMYLDPILFDRVNRIAEMISSSNSMPEHLRGDLGACMNVIDRAWNWGLSPWSVAQGQFTVRRGATPGYYGRLIIAALNNSGRIEGGLRFEHFADGNASWENVLGKFEMRQSQKTDANGEPIKYARPTYKDEDERGLGVKVIGKLKGEEQPREMKVYLRQCQPRNSVIWATDPMTQIIYTAARRFGNAYCPDVLLGVRTEDDFGPEERGEMRDITPKAPPPVDLAAEGIKGGGETATTGRTFDQEREAGEKSNTTMRASGQAGGGTAKGDTQPTNGNTQEGDTVDPETGEVTEGKPKRQRRSYREIADDVIAMLADAESPDEVDAIVDDQVTGGVRSNTALMGEINKAAQDAHQRFAEQNQERAPAPAAEAQDPRDDGEFDLGGGFGRSA